MHEMEIFMYRNYQEGIESHEKHPNSSLAYLPLKVAIAVLRFPRISRISVRGYAKEVHEDASLAAGPCSISQS